MDCKNALVHSQDNFDQALEYLHHKGISAAGKKAGRETQAGLVSSYIHFGGKIGVLVEINCETDFVARNDEFQTLVKDVAIQIAGASPPPLYVQRSDIPVDVTDKERTWAMAEVEQMGKPAAILEKIANGKVEKRLQELCLLDQPFIKDPQLTVREMIAKQIAKLGENIQVRRFTRYQLGTSA